VVVVYTYRCVDAAEKELQVRRALYLNQWPELVHFHASFFLVVVVKLIGHIRLVVADALAHWNGNLFTFLLCESVGADTQHHEFVVLEK